MKLITISDGKQLQVDLLDFGARIAGIRFTNVAVALGYENLRDYKSDAYYMGTTVGPITNRIAKSELCINDQRFSLPANEGANCLHSGGRGFDQQVWTVINNTSDSVEFELVFELATIGLQGVLTTRAHYVVADGALNIEYRSHTDTETYINLTNHFYLNLSGQRQAVADHRFELFAESLVEVDKENIPTGKLNNVTNPLNYQLTQPLAHNIAFADHHFNAGQDGLMKLMLKAHSPTSRINLKVSGTSPGFQFYTGTYLEQPFVTNQGFCVETQFAPNAINHANFYSPLLQPGEIREQITVLQFSVEPF